MTAPVPCYYLVACARMAVESGAPRRSVPEAAGDICLGSIGRKHHFLFLLVKKLLSFSGTAQDSEDSVKKDCPECLGTGKQVTRKPPVELVPCRECNGKGWIR